MITSSQTPNPESLSSDMSTDNGSEQFSERAFGFTRSAERLNGRLAMVGFLSLLALATLSKHDVLPF
jgi:hypothetical protein